jgi:hypothetical protein
LPALSTYRTLFGDLTAHADSDRGHRGHTGTGQLSDAVTNGAKYSDNTWNKIYAAEK